MKKLKCIIIDDEITAIESLLPLINMVPELELIGTFNNPLDALTFLRKNDVYLVFLDINMSALSGLDLAKRIANKIIFTTGHSEFALKAFELSNIVDYLAKPIYFDRFLKAIKKALGHYVADNSSAQTLIDGYLVFKQNGATVKIDHDSILFIQSIGNYTAVHYDEKRIVSPMGIWDIEKILPQNKFVRVNRSCIANKGKVVGQSRKEIILLGGRKLRTGKAYKDGNVQ